jgi:hypothetical protein
VVHRTVSRAALLPRLSAAARVHDAALLALRATRPADHAGTEAAEWDFAACTSGDGDQPRLFESLDLAFESLGSLGSRG